MPTLKEMRRDMAFAGGLLRRRPFQVLLQVTNRCNMTCSFCDFWSNGASPKEELTLDDFRRLESRLSELGTFMVSIEGGEPFLRPDLVEIVRIFSKRHLPLLYTNGWHVTPRSARRLFEAGLTQIGVSIDYAEAARHDAKRGLAGAFDKAWQSIETLRDAAPNAGKQVHVMTVLMKDNQADLERLLTLSAGRGVGHCVTLLSKNGFRRGGKQEDETPDPAISKELVRLWKRHKHFRVFRNYLERIETFLAGGPLPACRAVTQSFNIDHLGNVSPCIEKIGEVMGNIKSRPLRSILDSKQHRTMAAGCQDCWTMCRGFSQAMGSGGELSGWRDLVGRMRSV